MRSLCGSFIVNELKSVIKVTEKDIRKGRRLASDELGNCHFISGLTVWTMYGVKQTAYNLRIILGIIVFPK